MKQNNQIFYRLLGVFLAIIIFPPVLFANDLDDRSLSKHIVKLNSLVITEKVNLNNIFSQPPQVNNSHQLSSDQQQLPKTMPLLKLVGTLIIGEQKQAWIKAGANLIHELMPGQAIPGSIMSVGQIYPDSVEVFNAENCQSFSLCDSKIILEIYSRIF